MKKNILYLLLLILSAISACDPMDDTYNELDQSGSAYTKALTFTLAKTYNTLEAANIAIPAYLNTTYAQLGNGSTANVTYATSATRVVVADSIFSNIADTVTSEEYTLINKSTKKYFTATNVLKLLENAYPSASTVANKLVVLTYVYFESGVTTTTGTQVTESFLLLDGIWTKIYHVSASQYTLVGRGGYGDFLSSDVSKLPSYFNTFLKADPTVMSAVKSGDVKYVSYKYYASDSYQKVMKMTYDGTDWSSTKNTLSFIKLNDVWIPDPTIYYTLKATDYTNISANTSLGNTANRANLASYKNFNQSSSTAATYWSDDQIKATLIYILDTKYPDAAVTADVPYKVTYYVYTGSYTYLSMTFIKTDAGFVLK